MSLLVLLPLLLVEQLPEQSPQAEAQVAGAFQRSPERNWPSWKLLNRRRGTWDEQVKFFPSEGKAEFKQTASWTLNERFLEMHSFGARGYESRILLGCAGPDVVVMWYFNSAGEWSRWNGAIDQSGVQVTWTSDIRPGVTGTATWSFEDPNLLVWKSAYHDSAGKVLEEIRGTNQRITEVVATGPESASP